MGGDLQELTEGGSGQTRDFNGLMQHLHSLAKRYQGKGGLGESSSLGGGKDEEEKTNLPAITTEAGRQRDALLQKTRAIIDANKHLQLERAGEVHRFTSDNSQLIGEINRLRHEKVTAERRITDLEVALASSMNTGGNNTTQGTQGPGHSSSMSMNGPTTTPYLERKKNQETELQRVMRKKAENSLSGAGSCGAAGVGGQFALDRIRDQLPATGSVGNFPLTGANGGNSVTEQQQQSQEVLYTGGPIAPTNTFPAV